MVNAVKFCVRPASILKSLKVLELFIFTDHVLVVAFQKLLYVFHPHENLATPEAEVYFIVEVEAFKVRFVEIDTSHNTAHALLKVHVPDHIFIVRVFEFEEENTQAIVILLLFASNVHEVNALALVVESVKSSCKVSEPLGALIVNVLAQVFVALFSV